MRITYNWIKDYVNAVVPPEKLAQILTMAGLSVESIQKAGSDSVLEVEVTSNRPDWLSAIGIAREISALTGAKLKIPAITMKRVPGSVRDSASIKVEDKRLCPRYTARVIRNVKVQESPAWLKTKIEAMGLRSVNNIVDITNFCLFETGEPMHAFDLDKISGNEVIIRKAKKGEKITVIDGSVKTLDDSVLVIADSLRPIAMAGVMGGLSTEVTASTKNILLEAAFFDPISIRRTSRRFAITTESSYRFERRVDLENIPYASDRAASLIIEIAGGSAGSILDIGEKKTGTKTVSLRCEALEKISGAAIGSDKVKKILTSLGLKVKLASKEKITLDIPSFRVDLNDEIDIIEEVVRIYGYDKITGTIPKITEQPVRLDRDFVVAGKIREVLSAFGADEIITYSLLSKNEVNSARDASGTVIEIQNPLSAEQEVMRPNLTIGMLKSILWNINRKTKDLTLFEIGKVYHRDAGGKFSENRHVSIGITGQVSSDWVDQPRDVDFFDLKGMVENMLSELGIRTAEFKDTKNAGFASGACASVEIGGEPVGIIGEVSGDVLNSFDIKEAVYFCEMCAGIIMKYANLEKKFIPLPKYPSVFRDVSIVVDGSIANADMVATIRKEAGSILKDIRLIDRYSGKQIPDGKIGLTYRLEYQNLSKTLEEKDISEVHTRILHALETNIGAKLR